MSKGTRSKSCLHPDKTVRIVRFWLNLESAHPYFAAILSRNVCRAIQCVAVYQGVSSAFAFRKREY